VPKLKVGSRSLGWLPFAIVLSLGQNSSSTSGRRMLVAAFVVHVPKLRQPLHGKIEDL
jgi:hypothetical protein